MRVTHDLDPTPTHDEVYGNLGNNNSSNGNDDSDDDDNDNTNDDDDTDNTAAAGGGTGAAGGPIPGSSTTTSNYVPTIPVGGPGTFPVRPNVTTTSTTTTTTQIIGPQPILLDLDGNGIQLTDLTRSTVFMEGDEGLKHRTAWAGAGDGVLFYDTDGDNAISDIREYVFTEWDPTAKDDLAALRSRFDTNGDGKLTGTELTGFKVMRTNPDGSLTAVTLASLNITQINLTEDTTHIEMPDGSVITGQGTYLMGGVTRTLANTTLATEADGSRVVETVSVTGGVRTVVQTGYDAAGAADFNIRSLTNAKRSRNRVGTDDFGAIIALPKLDPGLASNRSLV